MIDPYYLEATTNKGMAYVDRAIIAMKEANIAFNVPETMRLSETIEIVLLLDITKKIEALKQIIQAKGKKEGAIVNVTNRMGADLKGSNFKNNSNYGKIAICYSSKCN